MRPLDDDFMRCMFEFAPYLPQFFLRIVLDRDDLSVLDYKTQKEFLHLAGSRSVCLDVYAVDTDGTRYDIEVQRANKGADIKRAIYNMSCMATGSLKPGQSFQELPKLIVIFLTEHDIFKQGKPLYLFQLQNEAITFDEVSFLYINASHKDESSSLGKLIHDFNCSRPQDMYYNEMKESTLYLKENTKGVKHMCKIMEECHDEGKAEGKAEGKTEIAASLIKDGMYSLPRIAELTGLSLQAVDQLHQKIITE